MDESDPTLTAWDDAKPVDKNAIIKMLSKHTVPSLEHLNKCKLSLGAIFLKAGDWQGESVKKEEPALQEEHASLFDDLADQVSLRQGKDTFDPTNVKYVPRIRFKDSAGNHFLQMREWGAWLLMGNPEYRDKQDALWTAPGYMRNKDTLFILGNMTNRRNNWMVLKLFQFDAKTDRSLFE